MRLAFNGCATRLVPLLIATIGFASGPSADPRAGGVPVPRHPESLRIDDELTVSGLADGIYVFRSRPWNANSLLVVDGAGAAVLVDTPAMPRTTRTLLEWTAQALGVVPTAAVNSHYHLDASGGNQVLSERGIRIYASESTRALLTATGAAYRDEVLALFEKEPAIRQGLAEIRIALPDETVADHGARDFRVGSIEVRLEHHGPTHSPDHLAIVFPKLGVLYGGCAVRHGASLGNVREVRDFAAWRRSILRLRGFDARFVIPGHGAEYGPDLLDNTLGLLDAKLAEP